MPICANLFVFLVGLAFLFAGTLLVTRSLRFRRHGIETTGQVVAIHSRPGSEGGTMYHPVIRFTERSTAHQIEFTEGTGYGRLPRRLHVGNKVRIRYLPTNSQKAMLVSLWNSAFLGFVVIGAGLFVWGFLIANLFFGYQYPASDGGGFLSPFHTPWVI